MKKIILQNLVMFGESGSPETRSIIFFLFGVCFSFNIAMSIFFPLRAYKTWQQLELIKPGMTYFRVREILSEQSETYRGNIAEGKQVDQFLTPIYILDSNTWVKIYYDEKGIVQKVDLPYKVSSIQLIRILRPKIILGFIPFLFVIAGTKFHFRSLLAIAYCLVFTIALFNLFIIALGL